MICVYKQHIMYGIANNKVIYNVNFVTICDRYRQCWGKKVQTIKSLYLEVIWLVSEVVLQGPVLSVTHQAHNL